MVRYSRQQIESCDRVNHGRDTLNLPLLCFCSDQIICGYVATTVQSLNLKQSKKNRKQSKKIRQPTLMKKHR